MQIELNAHSGKKRRIFAFSDTHGKHRQVVIPNDADTVVFAGDACEGGDHVQLEDFFAWFASLPAKNKLFVPGNHDLPFDIAPDFARRMIPNNVLFKEQGALTVDGIHFYILPARMGLHFETAPRAIPSNIDVLVTHCPPKNILDENGRWGCPILRELIDGAAPQIHIFGHSHQTGGQSVQEGKTLFWNVAVKQM